MSRNSHADVHNPTQPHLQPFFTSLHGPGQVESIGGTLTVEEAPAPALLAAAGAEGSLEVTKRALEDILHIYDDV